MRVYITGERGSKTAFKITTSRVISNVDSVIEDAMNTYLNRDDREPFNEWLAQSWRWILPVLYYGELDGKDNFKKMNKNSWIDTLDDYAERHPAEYAKFELLKK